MTTVFYYYIWITVFYYHIFGLLVFINIYGFEIKCSKNRFVVFIGIKKGKIVKLVREKVFGLKQSDEKYISRYLL